MTKRVMTRATRAMATATKRAKAAKGMENTDKEGIGDGSKSNGDNNKEDKDECGKRDNKSDEEGKKGKGEGSKRDGDSNE